MLMLDLNQHARWLPASVYLLQRGFKAATRRWHVQVNPRPSKASGGRRFATHGEKGHASRFVSFTTGFASEWGPRIKSRTGVLCKCVTLIAGCVGKEAGASFLTDCGCKLVWSSWIIRTEEANKCPQVFAVLELEEAFWQLAQWIWFPDECYQYLLHSARTHVWHTLQGV